MLRGDRETIRLGWCLPGYAMKGWLLGLLTVIAWFTIASAASKQELLVSAAISLKEPLQEIGALFEQRHPEVKVIFNWGASGALQQQIAAGTFGNRLPAQRGGSEHCAGRQISQRFRLAADEHV